MTHPFSQYRSAFPILETTVQLSSCSQSAMCLPVQEAIQAYLSSWSSHGMDWERWMEVVDGARGEFARLIGAQRDEIAILGSVSDAASSVVSCFDLKGGRDTLVCAETDFPSLGHVMLAQRARGARVRWVVPEGERLTTGSVAASLDDSVALACLSHVSYANAAKVDIAQASHVARGSGAALLVDAYQSAGALAIDVERMGIDMLATGAQKFLLGIPGIAFLYVRRSLARALETRNTGWFGRVQPFAFDIKTLDYADDAGRFNTGTPPMACAYAARAGLRMLNEIGADPIEQYLTHLSGIGGDEAKRLGLSLAGPAEPQHRGTTLAIRFEQAAKAEQAMRRSGYIVSARGDVVRMAPHFYNTEDEVVGALRALAALRTA